MLAGGGQLFNNTEVKIVTSTLAAELLGEVISRPKGPGCRSAKITSADDLTSACARVLTAWLQKVKSLLGNEMLDVEKQCSK